MVKENYTISKPQIVGNGYKGPQGEGVIFVTYDPYTNTTTGLLRVCQYEKWVEGDRINRNTREGLIGGPVDTLVEIDYTPGEITGGRCCIIESFDPPNPDDPEEGIKYIDGKICRVDGRVVYRVTRYSFSAHEADILIEPQ